MISKTLLLSLLFVLQTLFIQAQTADNKAQAAGKKDEARLNKLKAKGIYPAIDASKMSGVLPVPATDITEKPDSNLKYKLLVSFTMGSKGAEKVKEMNKGLAEIGRIYNLHLAAGIAKEKIDLVIVAHSLAVYSLLNNEGYKKEFKTDNPNLAIVQQLKKAGARFIACGQTMQFSDIDKTELDPDVKISLSAKTALSTYLLKGYALYEIDEEE